MHACSNSALAAHTAIQKHTIVVRALPGSFEATWTILCWDLCRQPSHISPSTWTLPLELFQLANLEELALNQNFFIGSIPTTIGQLLELLWFDMSYNQMSGNLPLQLANPTKALHFHLHINRFSRIIPVGIFSVKQPLVHLLLHNNSFEGPIPSDTGNLIAVEILYVGGCTSTRFRMFRIASLKWALSHHC
ncbi:hypothetical protein GOP47_0008398 [Adiantum capillus-veneris]|uniref:Uncharacterized protein n=1 Tax=Adiantum capillus-veneris TaxID=13818 RepID=A0A9D4UYH8_ADICA|nr:hypothetical protein GOP47_0008398 [Adiantum capillus-veneris]